MEYTDIFQVSRAEYKGFVNEIKPEYRDVKEIQLNSFSISTQIYSKKTGKCLCSRVSYKDKPEEYYIFEMPDNDERQAQIPKQKVILETPEQVQKVFNYIFQKRKEEEKKID